MSNVILCVECARLKQPPRPAVWDSVKGYLCEPCRGLLKIPREECDTLDVRTWRYVPPREIASPEVVAVSAVKCLSECELPAGVAPVPPQEATVAVSLTQDHLDRFWSRLTLQEKADVFLRSLS